MKKGIAAVLVLALAGTAGAGTAYRVINKSAAGGADRVSSDSTDAVYVDSVSMLADLGTGSGIVARYAGVVEPQETSQVKLENEKTVAETYVKVGDEVKVGDKLFKYNTADDEDKAAKGEIDIERDKNNIETAKNQIKQLQAQQKKANADDQLALTTQILEQENQIKQYEYEIKTKQIEIETAKKAVENAVVKSELDGVIKSITDPSTSSSSNISEDNSGAYITIMAMGDFRIKGSINEQNFSDIGIGDEVVVFSRVDNSVMWKGTIDDIKTDSGSSNQSSDYGMTQDNGTGSTVYPFYIKLESDEGLMLGQHVYIEPNVGQTDKKTGIWLPSYYFTMDDDGSAWVWAASSSNKLEKRQVTLGEYDEGEDKYEITEGLKAEDYITTPNDTYTAGMPVSYIDYSEGGVYDGDADQGEFSDYEGIEGFDDFGSTYEEIDGSDWEGGSYEEISYEDWSSGSCEEFVVPDDGSFVDADEEMGGVVYDDALGVVQDGAEG